MWLVTNIEPEEALRLYPKRMKIKQSFRDEKSRLGLDRLMSQSRSQMEKLVALVLLAYGIGVWIGEVLRDQLYGPADEAGAEAKRRNGTATPASSCSSGEACACTPPSGDASYVRSGPPSPNWCCPMSELLPDLSVSYIIL
ncbi:MAG: hypothetical protein M3P51_17285 [Chloroflexota bacterium]|nr:hypothetical protein [Chloroflexota bacterium]